MRVSQYSLRTMLSWAFNPATEAMTPELIRQGREVGQE